MTEYRFDLNSDNKVIAVRDARTGEIIPHALNPHSSPAARKDASPMPAPMSYPSTRPHNIIRSSAQMRERLGLTPIAPMLRPIPATTNLRHDIAAPAFGRARMVSSSAELKRLMGL